MYVIIQKISKDHRKRAKRKEDKFRVEFKKLRPRGYFVIELHLYSHQKMEISDDSMQNQNMIINL